MKRFFICILLLIGIINHIDADITVPEMSNISYDYDVTFSGSSYDSMGTLTIDVRVPVNTKNLYFYHTTVRYRNVPEDKLFFSVMTILTELPEQGQSKTYSFDKIRWGIYFKLVCTDEDNNRISSDVLCSSSYMDPDDLKLILDSNSNIDEVSKNTPNIYIQDRRLIVESDEALDLSIFTLDGKQIYNNHEISTSEIDLRDVPSQILMIKYSTSDAVKTKKILLR